MRIRDVPKNIANEVSASEAPGQAKLHAVPSEIVFEHGGRGAIETPAGVAIYGISSTWPIFREQSAMADRFDRTPTWLEILARPARATIQPIAQGQVSLADVALTGHVDVVHVS